VRHAKNSTRVLAPSSEKDGSLRARGVEVMASTVTRMSVLRFKGFMGMAERVSVVDLLKLVVCIGSKLPRRNGQDRLGAEFGREFNGVHGGR